MSKILTPDQEQELENSLERIVTHKMNSFLNKQMPKRFVPGMDGDGGLPDGGFKSFSDFCKAIVRDRSNPKLKALGEGVDSQGGFTVPESFRNNIFERTIERSIVRPRASVIPCATDTLNWPAYDDSSHASSLGGIICYWGEEAGALTESQPDFRQVKLILKKLTGYTRTSNELLEDNQVGLGLALEQRFSAAIAWYEDLAFLRGTGVGQPLGIFGSGALITVPRAVVNQVSLADLSNIMARIYPDSHNSPSLVWVFSPAVLQQLVPLVATVITLLPGASAANAFPRTILGVPWMCTEKVPTLGTTGDIGLYDMQFYSIADRGNLRIDVSSHIFFNADQVAWRFVERVDGHSLVDSTFTPYNGGATLSPFVQLSSSTS